MDADVSMNSTQRSHWYSRDVTMQSMSGQRTSFRRSTARSGREQYSGNSGLVRFTAPSGLSDNDDESGSDGCTPSFSMQAPGYSSDDETEVTSKPIKEISGHNVRRVSPAQQALHSLRAKVDARLLGSAQSKVEDFQNHLRRIDQAEAHELELIKARRRQCQELAAGADQALMAEQSADQKQLLAGLQKQHDSQAQVMARQAKVAETQEQQKRDAAEAARNAAEAKARKEQEAKEAETKAKALAAEQAATERARQVQEEKEAAQKADAERRERSAPALASASGQTHGLLLRPEAANFEAECSTALQKQQEAIQILKQDKSQNSAKRDLYKSINKIVGQIGGTQEQVNTKSNQLLQLLAGVSEQLQSFALVHLAEGFLDLAEGSDSRFAPAEVAVTLGNAHPSFVPVLLAKLHQACPLTVPKVILKLKSESADAYFQRWAYRRAEQWSKKTKAMVEGWEEQEVYLRRVTAHVQFYAAFLQSDNQKQVGIDHAWAYMSRLLNLGVCNRYTAFALTAFIEIAGYRLYCAFSVQAMKLLQYVWHQFLPSLEEHQGTQDIASAARRLRHYLQEQNYLQEPPGRRLEMYDTSTYDRA